MVKQHGNLLTTSKHALNMLARYLFMLELSTKVGNAGNAH